VFAVKFREIPRAFKVISLAVLLLFAFAACEQERPGIQSPNYFASDIPEELFPIRYRIKWQHQAQFAGSYMAYEKGFYLKLGLEVEILPGGVSHPPYKSLINKESEISNINLFSAIETYHKGPPLVNLAQISQSNSTLLVGKKTSGIKTLNDLQGKRIGVWRDEQGDYIRLFFEYLGLDVQIVPMDWSVNLLLNDAVDVMNAMTYNEYHRLLMAGLDEDELITFDLADYGFNLIDDGLYATRDFYDNHTQECIAFAEATTEGWIYALNHREETLNVILRYLRLYNLPANRAHQAWMLDHMYWHIFDESGAIGYLSPSDFKMAHEILEEHGWIPQPVDYKTFYPHEIRKKN
jgi:NitT/TauT family transport system substrate-binding protein